MFCTHDPHTREICNADEMRKFSIFLGTVDCVVEGIDESGDVCAAVLALSSEHESLLGGFVVEGYDDVKVVAAPTESPVQIYIGIWAHVDDLAGRSDKIV